MLYRSAPRFWNQYVDEINRPVSSAPHTPDPAKWPDTGLHAAWLGHSTLLLKLNGATILTDPVFSERAGVSVGPVTLGVKRLVEPALMPPLVERPDLILLSHAHMDHFDVPSLRSLEHPKTSVVTAWETADLLRPNGYRKIDELRWGQSVHVGPLSIRAFEVNHWGARFRADDFRGYNGYVIESGRHRVLFAGDTADTHLFRQLKTSKPIDLAIMPIGAYNPWIWYHCNPEQAWRMGNEAGAEFFIPVHHQTFALGNEPTEEPIERFYNAAANHADRIAADAIGRELHLG